MNRGGKPQRPIAAGIFAAAAVASALLLFGALPLARAAAQTISAAETSPDIENARTLAAQAQQRARAEEQKAQAAAQRAASERASGAGYGFITYKVPGSYYWGQKNAAGQRDGDGVFQSKFGRCECRFANDALIGDGVMLTTDGDRYEGAVSDGTAASPAGYGVFTWTDGRRFEGQFAANKPNGAGILTDALGARHAGIWRNGVLLSAGAGGRSPPSADRRPPPLADSIANAPTSAAPAGAPAAAAATGAYVVPLGVHGNSLATIPVEINGALRIPFIVDSGASDVALPEDVVRVLLRAGTIDKSDLLGRTRYITADGKSHYGLRLHIRELRVGDRIVRDVTAGVSPERGDPLLGQSFLSRFGAWTIDNTTHQLILQPK